MTATAVSTLRFWDHSFNLTVARELPRTYSADARTMRIELDHQDEMGRTALDELVSADGTPSPYLHVTDDAVAHSGTRWTGLLDEVSLHRLEDGRRMVVLTYRNADLKSEFEKLLEALP